jgi:hypothetical protein
MFEYTETGFRVTFEDADDPLLLLIQRGFFNLTAGMWDFLKAQPMTRARRRGLA